MPSSRHKLHCQISQSLWNAIQSQLKDSGESLSHLIERSLANELKMTQHTLFQVSTSRALVEGVFGGYTTVEQLKQFGDFGLGTFDQLDGEMILLDGHCYQALQEGGIHEVDDEATVPFATVTRFSTDHAFQLKQVSSFSDFTNQLDQIKPSSNLFAGFRVEGNFKTLALRAACRAEKEEKLVEAISHQSVFSVDDVVGTLVGFWAPPYSSAISVPGYHFHFVDEKRKLGGHVFDLTAESLEVAVHLENEIHLALPETREFLEADLQSDGSEKLKSAETSE